MFLKILIFFFICLIVYQVFLALFANNLVEGLEISASGPTSGPTSGPNEYKPYNTNDPTNPNGALILSQQNAGNIEVLKGRVDDLDGVKFRVDTMQQNIDSMQVQINALVQQQADYANDLMGDQPIDLSPDEDEDEDEGDTNL